MASSQTHLFSLLLFFIISYTSSHEPTKPNSIVLPISKNALTLQYTTIISQRTPLVPLNVVIDLNGPFLWVGCDSTYDHSPTFKSAQCPSPLCSLAHSNQICHKNSTCVFFFDNVFTSKLSYGELKEDVLSLNSTNGFYPTSKATVPQFPFLCALDSLPKDILASGARGVAGLGPGRLGLPVQLVDAFNFSRKFAMCLSPLSQDAYSTGVIFFGDGPYVLLPGIDISKLLIFTPLMVKRPKGMFTTRIGHIDEPYLSFEYYIKVNSIRVNGKQVPLNSSLLTKISTINPYTIMESSLYRSLTRVFIEEALAQNFTRVLAPGAPFEVCFSTKITINGGAIRPAMPVIDLVLQDEKVFWRIFETNLMVPVGIDTTCLGFLEGGANLQASILIGGHQLEDNMLQFDLVSSRLGFTSTLLWRETNCASFNFSSEA